MWQELREFPGDVSLAHVQGGKRGTQVQLLKSSYLACWAMVLDHGWLAWGQPQLYPSNSIPSLAGSPRSKNPVDSLSSSLPCIPHADWSLDFPHLCSQECVSNRPSGFTQLMSLELPIQPWDSHLQECFLSGYLLAQKTCVGRACYLVTCNAWIMITINQTSLLCAGELDGPTG